MKSGMRCPHQRSSKGDEVYEQSRKKEKGVNRKDGEKLQGKEGGGVSRGMRGVISGSEVV